MVAGCRDGRIKCFSGGENSPVGISSNSRSVPQSFKLHQNYPNPFNPSTTIKFDLPRGTKVSLVIYDILGRQVETIVNGNFEPGSYTYSWDASKYGSGVYFCKMVSDKNTDVKKMLLVK
jgi:hypothetical protein